MASPPIASSRSTLAIMGLSKVMNIHTWISMILY
jgi:hypothetical protein